MISLPQLWLPIVLSAVFVYVASSLIHMVVKWHNPDYLSLPNEDEVRAAIRRMNPAPGQYVLPRITDMGQLKSPDVQKKFVEGPVGFLMLRKSGSPNMLPSLVQWFFYSLLVSLFAAYLSSRTLSLGTHYLKVFRVTGTVAFPATRRERSRRPSGWGSRGARR
ncbi:MAG TPA: hypothetical protein VMK66_13535 [Myxococcales bacterium]|nr:hypothetical protein [Myxococcales bacterium]